MPQFCNAINDRYCSILFAVILNPFQLWITLFAHPLVVVVRILAGYITPRPLIATAEIRPSCGRIQSICEPAMQATRATRGTVGIIISIREPHKNQFSFMVETLATHKHTKPSHSPLSRSVSPPDHKMQGDGMEVVRTGQHPMMMMMKKKTTRRIRSRRGRE